MRVPKLGSAKKLSLSSSEQPNPRAAKDLHFQLALLDIFPKITTSAFHDILPRAQAETAPGMHMQIDVVEF